MEIKVELNNLRTAPRKVRQVIDLVRGKPAIKAQSMLSFTVNKSARNVLKLLNSAIASAKHDFQIDESNLFISKICADEGPKLKRWHPMSRGRAYTILKRTSHITLVLSEITPSTRPGLVDKKAEKPEKTAKSRTEKKVKSIKKAVRKTAKKK